ncbi:MAG: glycosyltransferase family 2 protein [Gemmatimonadetes bacterium]|nr:glycosyltransferase family 2 protein [Gemmatimonadota bacterium]
MRREEVLAVVVSYNGLHKTAAGVEALRRQVGHVHIVDNGSRAESLAELALLEQHAGVTVERLPNNRGVGFALNRGVARARELGCAWLLTMDQDSVVAESMMAAYERAVARGPERVCLAPTLASRAAAGDPSDVPVSAAITSGNLVRVSLFDSVGLYDEGLFIDAVDFDFCLRVRAAGHSIFRVSDALMHHRVGDPFDGPRVLRRLYVQHDAARRYYISRNFLYLAQRHGLLFPWFIAKLAALHLVHVVLVGAFDPRARQSYRAMWQGIRDFFGRRVGPYGSTVRDNS